MGCGACLSVLAKSDSRTNMGLVLYFSENRESGLERKFCEEL
jgi:hypothetical protein